MAIIGISGKIGSGKDTVGIILQTLLSFPAMSTERVLTHLNKPLENSKFTIEKFGGGLKDIVCILLNCTREQLEDREFKEKELGEEWWCYTNTLFEGSNKILKPYIGASKKLQDNTSWYIHKLTPRKLLQLLGTESMRNIIHPNIWINALMSKYKSKKESIGIDRYGVQTIVDNRSNWIITDLRFPNELKAIEDREGICIRVNRPRNVLGNPRLLHKTESQHESETALDKATFKYTIDNNGTLEELVEKVRVIINKEGIHGNT